MANEQKIVYGSATTVISLAASLANDANTYTGQASITMLELDNSSTNYPLALAVLEVPETFAAAPSAGASFGLYINRNDIDGTSDWLPVPVSTDLKGAPRVGTFPIPANDEAMRIAIVISLLGVKKANFFIQNKTGQATTYSASPLTVKITPFTYAPT